MTPPELLDALELDELELDELDELELDELELDELDELLELLEPVDPGSQLAVRSELMTHVDPLGHPQMVQSPEWH